VPWLVTPAGAGGIGKTRLALSVASDVADEFAGGACYVDLVPVVDAATIAPAIAGALGPGESHGRSATATIEGLARAVDPKGFSTVTDLQPAWGLPAGQTDPNGKRTDLG
jgi:hypothetical protein